MILRTYPLGVIITIVISTESTSEMRGLRLMLDLLSKLTERTVWSILALTCRRGRGVEVRCIRLTEIRCWSANALLLRCLRQLRRSLVLHGVEVSRQPVLDILMML